ncbi:MAG TPA: GAF domain-containing protein [Blastocatellia bacterium]|nr:GAF domain-containing protein [Blastocatellia bacterium]
MVEGKILHLSEARVVRALLDISKEISNLRPLEETLQLVVERVRELLGTDLVAIATTDDLVGSTSWKAVAGGRTDAFTWTTFAPGKGTAARTIAARKTIMLNGVGQRPDLPLEEFPIHKAEGIRSVIGVPLFHGQRIVGVLIAGYRGDSTFAAGQIELAEALAGHAAVAIENARLFTELENANKRLLDADRLKTEMIFELSTPVIPVSDSILLAPIIGTLTTDRAQMLTQAILNRTRGGRPEVIILDITGMRLIDSDAAQHLRNTVAAARVLGAHCIVTGIGATLARKLVQLGINFEGIETRRKLSDGLKLARDLQADRR